MLCTPHYQRCRLAHYPSPPRGGEAGPIAERWEGEVGVDRTAGVSPACRPEAGGPSGIPHLTPTLSAPKGGEGVRCSANRGGLSRRDTGTTLPAGPSKRFPESVMALAAVTLDDKY